jgi:hypothetical protein
MNCYAGACFNPREVITADMGEVRVEFSIGGKQYILFVEKGLLKSRFALFECQKGGNFINPIPVEISTAPPGELIGFRLGEIKRRFRHWRKKRQRTKTGWINRF